MKRNEDFAGFALAIGKMFLSCGGRDVTDLLVESYWDDLCHLTLDQVAAAIPEAKRLADRGFPPDAEGIRRCAEKRPTAPYHARLALPEFTPKEEWPEAPPGMAERVMALVEQVAVRKSLEAQAEKQAREVLGQRQWPETKGTR